MSKKQKVDFSGLRMITIGIVIMASSLCGVQSLHLLIHGLVTEIAFAVSFVMGWIFVMIGLKTLRRYRNEFKAAYFIGFVGVFTTLIYGFVVASHLGQISKIPVTTSMHVVFLMFISIVLMILTQRKILEGVGELAYIQKHPSLRRKCLRVWKLIWLFVILTLFGEQMARFFEGSVRYIITVGFALCALIFQFIAAGYVISGYDLVEQSNKES